MTVLRPGELLTAIRIPSTWAGAQFYFEKVRDRQVWDFPLVNVAAAIKASGGTIRRGAAGGGRGGGDAAAADGGRSGVAGKPRNDETAKLAGRAGGRRRAALRYNGYKVPLMRNLVMRAIRGQQSAPRTT